MLPEDQEIGNIDYRIFKEYIQLNGGYVRFALVVVVAMVCWISLTIASLMIMEQWCEDPVANSNYLYLYVGFSVGSGLFIFLRAYKLVMSGAQQGQLVHRRMTKALLYASLGNFFNRVPVGRIINRLTKDLR
jgi:ABC-type multidrug transport system fused ATPase/permease subunit